MASSRGYSPPGKYVSDQTWDKCQSEARCGKVRGTEGRWRPPALSSVLPQCPVCVTPTPRPACTSICPQWPPPAACQPAEGRAEFLLQRCAIFRSCQISFGSKNVGEWRGRDAGRLSFDYSSNSAPSAAGALAGSLEGPLTVAYSFSSYLHTSWFFKSSSGTRNAASSGWGGRCEMPGGSSRQALRCAASQLGTLDKPPGFPSLVF